MCVHVHVGGTAAAAASSEDGYDNEDSEQEAGMPICFDCRLPVVLAPLLGYRPHMVASLAHSVDANPCLLVFTVATH